MSYEGAIKSRKEELAVLEKVLKEDKKEKNQKQVDYLEPRIQDLKDSIKGLEIKMGGKI